MSKLVNLVCLVFLTNFIGKLYALPATPYTAEYFDKIIETVNAAGAHWEAGHNFEDYLVDLENLVGSLDSHNHQLESGIVNLNNKPCIHTASELLRESNEEPVRFADEKVGMGNHKKSFDGFKAWKHCPSVKHVWNQGKCASDWVIAPVSAIADRLCIATNGSFQELLSPEAPLACCKNCGWGCEKGYASQVYQYFVDHGLVTGADYKSQKGCQPYSIKPAHRAESFVQRTASTPKCSEHCSNPKHTRVFSQDIIKGKEAFRYTCPYCVTGELARHGPITATMNVYEDFLTYKSGIYHHVAGKFLGKLTVKLVGFNDEVEPKYWEAVNSWGKKWGKHGTFKIRRVTDECMIEGSMHGAYVSKEQFEEDASSGSESGNDSSSSESVEDSDSSSSEEANDAEEE